MSTPASVTFTQGGKAVGSVYLHWDGYPENVLPLLDGFFGAIQVEASNDTRFYDASYLAARFVYYFGRMQDKGLNYTGIGLMLPGSVGVDYEYTVDCTGDWKPTVTYK